MHPLVYDPLTLANSIVQKDPSSSNNYEYASISFFRILFFVFFSKCFISFADEAKKNLNTWGLLHGVRTVVSATAFALAVRLVSKRLF
jgi:hypothetical protein